MNIGSTYALNGKIETEAMSVVMAQIAPKSAHTMEDVEFNTNQILSYMDKAAAGFPGYDLFMCPECGFHGFAPGDWPRLALTLDSEPINKVRAKCKELGVWGIFNPLVRENDGQFVKNMAILVNDKGEIVHKYVKMNPWLPDECTVPGTECKVVDGPKGSKIGIIICADGDYPEIWREAAVNGANVICRVSHYKAPYDEAWEITNKAGAYCNQTYVLGCNSVGIDECYTYFGNSMAVNPDGTVFARAPKGIPWLMKVDVYPGIVDKMRTQPGAYNFIWQYKHRGASCPDQNGAGRGVSDYNAYTK